MPTHTITSSYTVPSGSVVGNTVVTDNEELNIDVVLAAASTNIEVDIVLTRSQLKTLCLFCTGACTVKTNSSSAPSDTISLIAGLPNISANNAGVMLVLPTADTTKLFLTSAAGGTFSLRSIIHSTNP